MGGIQKELVTFPSVYSKDFKFFKDFKRPGRCGSYEPFTLEPNDAALFRVAISEDVFSEDKTSDNDFLHFKDKDPNHMKTIYMTDFKGEKLKAFAKEDCLGTLVEEIKKRIQDPKQPPLLPLVSSLRVFPGVPRYYHLPHSEFEDTIARLGMERLQKGTKD